MRGLTLVQIDFDNMENSNTDIRKTLATFLDEPTKSAYLKLSEFLAQMKPVQLYAGYDANIYPRFATTWTTIT
jgi:hypothetical protein